ncbi:MAG: DNA cytosine methyltransferase [Treponema sp.]|jgi:DNA (cytosine-5)-methyltransferase 1|nr:DNA cytosine methyltransferase [Treponema sp.]
MIITDRPLKAVDLFCGVGGLSRGFQDAGVEIIAGYDNWDKALGVYNANFESHKAGKLDLSDVSLAEETLRELSFDMIIGGPPCQDFSHAGKRVEKERADLTINFALIVTDLQPPLFVMENVDRITKSKAWETARRIFKSRGYGLTERVLDACYCGVPQRRKRYICVGVLGGTDGELSPLIEARLTPKPLTVRQYLDAEIPVEYYYRHPRNYCRRAIFSVDEPSPTIRGVNRPVPKGYPGHPNDPAPVTPELRRLTSWERSRIQTFPQDYVWLGSSSDMEQMIGNAVPVKLANFVAGVVKEYVESGGAAMEETHDTYGREIF